MKKSKTTWLCNSCGATFAKWSGKCEICGEWNTIQEFKEATPQKSKKGSVKTPESINSVVQDDKKRIQTGFSEFDRVLGGGVVSDGLYLLVGNPGIGKSTIVLQTAINIGSSKKVLIASGEESASQIISRANRISDNLPDIQILSEYIIEDVIATAFEVDADFLIVDSVQTLYSQEIDNNQGSIPQIRTITEKLMHYSKKHNKPCILIGHVNKDGDMAGPQVLAHLVDAVLVIEGDQNHDFRILRSTKNRFGSASEIGIFEMVESGLKEVANPSEAFLEGRMDNAIGSVVFPAIEGARALLVETQALTSTTKFGLPKRTASGLSLSRLSLILAVLQNHARLNFENRDVFSNIIGGFKISEPALDLALCAALISSHKKKPIPKDICVMGEVGLSGEIRAVNQLEKRLIEAQKMGFKKAVIPKTKNPPSVKGIDLMQIKSIGEMFEFFK
ncbi:MAG: DNA repair protein RadA [Candidatus Gracilibacteria bacterium]|jgi:DNA repair protein RadA/Sms|nr:DNA repair protein RadA [Candidatus Gracilibacteria bacterium]